MKFNRYTYPILRQLEKRAPYFIQKQAQSPLGEPYESLFTRLVKMRPQVDYLCKSQFRRVEGVKAETMGRALGRNQGVLLHDSLTYLYHVTSPGSSEERINIVVLEKLVVTCCVSAVYNNQGVTVAEVLYQPATNGEAVVEAVVGFLLFKKYAPTEEKLVEDNIRSISATSGVKQNEPANYPVSIIDERYITCYMRHTPFNVRGHIRRYKDGKVLEIEGFQKKGYIRKPRKGN